MWNWREEKKIAERELDRRRAATEEDAATSVIFAESDFTRLTTCGETKEYRVLKKEGASSRNFVYTLSLAIKQKKSGKFKNHATNNMPLSEMSLQREAKLA